MVIRLSPSLEKRVERAAKAKGIKPSKLVEEAVKEYLAAKGKPHDEVSEARRQLRELLKHKRKVVDFDAAVHEARREARQLEEDNAEWIERAGHRYQSEDK
ncbi:MAG: hypothetical protein M1570_18830 [Chloroflexi bacterium]|nr:hypothetical protein [Chloroflexota bacterium]